MSLAPEKQIEIIITELTRLQTVPLPYQEDNDFPLPRMIDAGNGRSLVVSRKIDDTITAVADKLMATDSSLAAKVTRHEWRSSVRAAFGPALAKIDLDDHVTQNATKVLAEIRTTLGERVSAYGIRIFTFGCTLFGNGNIDPFSIGPVGFETKSGWLARRNSNGEVSTTTRRRVERAWSGKRLAKRKPSVDSMREKDILDAVGNCPFVCSVTTTGMAAEAAREKAVTAARLALAAISLLWATPSRTLEGLNLMFDRRMHRKTILTSIPGKVVLAGSRWSHMPYGPWMKDRVWEKEFKEHQDHFRIAGEILDYLIDPTGSAERPALMNSLAQALLWFHEGCREAVNLMAIVKFSSALDALACGGKSSGIRRVINARLRMPDDKPIRPDGPTLKQAIDEIYSDGRSRTVHGTVVRLGHDWTGTRDFAEQFARFCLVACFDWAACNPLSDDPKALSQ